MTTEYDLRIANVVLCETLASDVRSLLEESQASTLWKGCDIQKRDRWDLVFGYISAIVALADIKKFLDQSGAELRIPHTEDAG